MDKDFINFTPTEGGGGSELLNIDSSPNITTIGRSTEVSVENNSGEYIININQSGLPILPTIGLTCNDRVSGNFNFNFFSYGFSVKSSLNENGADRNVSYMSIKTTAELPEVSEAADTLWYTRGCFLISNELIQQFSSKVSPPNIFMEVVTYKSGREYYDITEGDPEQPGISNYVMYHTRSKSGISKNYGYIKYVRFYLGDPELQGEYVCLVEYDFT